MGQKVKLCCLQCWYTVSESQLLHFRSSSLLMNQGKKRKMPQVTGPLSPMRQLWMEFQAPGYSLVQPWPFLAFKGSKPADKKTSLSPSLCLNKNKMNASFKFLKSHVS